MRAQFTGLATPDAHRPACPARPLLLAATGPRCSRMDHSGLVFALVSQPTSASQCLRCADGICLLAQGHENTTAGYAGKRITLATAPVSEAGGYGYGLGRERYSVAMPA